MMYMCICAFKHFVSHELVLYSTQTRKFLTIPLQCIYFLESLDGGGDGMGSTVLLIALLCKLNQTYLH